jgi:hypothetical protein
MELVKLKPLRNALVELPRVNGLSTEQRKRLTIAVELVANQLLLMKCGGQEIYAGPLGHHSSELIKYFKVNDTYYRSLNIHLCPPQIIVNIMWFHIIYPRDARGQQN